MLSWKLTSVQTNGDAGIRIRSERSLYKAQTDILTLVDPSAFQTSWRSRARMHRSIPNHQRLQSAQINVMTFFFQAKKQLFMILLETLVDAQVAFNIQRPATKDLSLALQNACLNTIRDDLDRSLGFIADIRMQIYDRLSKSRHCSAYKVDPTRFR